MSVLGFLSCLVMGLVLGLMGGGGALLTVPIMVYLFDLTPTIATGYSLFVVGLTALVGSLAYIRKGDINFKVGVVFAVPSVIGVNISRGLVIPGLPEVVFSLNGFTLRKEILIMATFAALMILASYSMINKTSEHIPKEFSAMKKQIRMALQGLIVGLLAGFVGAGGGFLLIPSLVLLAGLPMRVAVGTSLAIIAVQSLMGFAVDLFHGAPVDWSLLGGASLVAMVGIIFGSSVAHKIKEQNLKKGFGWFALFMGAIIFIEQLRQLFSK